MCLVFVVNVVSSLLLSRAVPLRLLLESLANDLRHGILHAPPVLHLQAHERSRQLHLPRLNDLLIAERQKSQLAFGYAVPALRPGEERILYVLQSVELARSRLPGHELPRPKQEVPQPVLIRHQLTSVAKLHESL